MTVAAIVTAAIDDVRQKFEACAADITPTAAVEGVSIYTQSPLPYWTLRFERMDAAPGGGNELKLYNITAQAVYHGWPMTGGQDGEHEEAAQRYLVWLPAEFDARPCFNSDTYPTGTGYLAPEGVVVTGARIAQTGSDTAQQLGVVVELTIPLELQIEEGY